MRGMKKTITHWARASMPRYKYNIYNFSLLICNLFSSLYYSIQKQFGRRQMVRSYCQGVGIDLDEGLMKEAIQNEV